MPGFGYLLKLKRPEEVLFSINVNIFLEPD